MVFDPIVPSKTELLEHYLVFGVIPVYFGLMAIIGRVIRRK